MSEEFFLCVIGIACIFAGFLLGIMYSDVRKDCETMHQFRQGDAVYSCERKK